MKIRCSFFSLLTEENHIGIVKVAQEMGASWPVDVVDHQSDGGNGTLVSVWEGEDHMFDYDLEANQSF